MFLLIEVMRLVSFLVCSRSGFVSQQVKRQLYISKSGTHVHIVAEVIWPDKHHKYQIKKMFFLVQSYIHR